MARKIGAYSRVGSGIGLGDKSRVFMADLVYFESFDRDSAGWWGWVGNDRGLQPLLWSQGAVTSRSPWWIDYNHAPPGAGYLHMLFCLSTRGPFSDHHKEIAGENRFAASRCPLDFREARITLRLQGELRARGAKLLLLFQGKIGDITSGWLLTGRPFAIDPEWSEQSVAITPDPEPWTCLRGRHDRLDYYNYLPLESIIGQVNANVMLVLFPLPVHPMGPLQGEPHLLRAGKDYPVWTSDLPEGYVRLDTVKIEFKPPAGGAAQRLPS